MAYLKSLQKMNRIILVCLKKEAKYGELTLEKTIEVSFDLDCPISEPDKSYGWKILDEIYQELDISNLIKASYVSKNQKN
jgi:transposase IS4-like